MGLEWNDGGFEEFERQLNEQFSDGLRFRSTARRSMRYALSKSSSRRWVQSPTTSKSGKWSARSESQTEPTSASAAYCRSTEIWRSCRRAPRFNYPQTAPRRSSRRCQRSSVRCSLASPR